MTLKAFLFLFVVTLAAVVVSALIAEKLVAPGFERGIIIAVLSALVVFPAARWAEYRGWIKGSWSPGGELRKKQDERREREAREQQELVQGAPPQEDRNASATEPIGAARDQDDPQTGRQTSPGESR